MKKLSRIYIKLRNGSDMTRKEKTLNSQVPLIVGILLVSKYQLVKLYHTKIDLLWTKKTRATKPRRVVTPKANMDFQISSYQTEIKLTYLKEVRAKSFHSRPFLKSQKPINPLVLNNQPNRIVSSKLKVVLDLDLVVCSTIFFSKRKLSSSCRCNATCLHL